MDERELDLTRTSFRLREMEPAVVGGEAAGGWSDLI
jgi:hypothetical protein